MAPTYLWSMIERNDYGVIDERAKLPPYPPVVRGLQIAKFLLIPAVILLYFALNNEWVGPPWNLVILIGLPLVAFPIIFGERLLRKRFERQIAEDRKAPLETDDPDSPSDSR